MFKANGFHVPEWLFIFTKYSTNVGRQWGVLNYDLTTDNKGSSCNVLSTNDTIQQISLLFTDKVMDQGSVTDNEHLTPTVLIEKLNSASWNRIRYIIAVSWSYFICNHTCTCSEHSNSHIFIEHLCSTLHWGLKNNRSRKGKWYKHLKTSPTSSKKFKINSHVRP